MVDLLGFELGNNDLNVGLRLLQLRRGLVLRGFVIAVVDPGQNVAGVDQLVVSNRHFDDRAHDQRADRHGPTVDKGVVCRLEVARLQPPENARNDGGDDCDRDGDRYDRMDLSQPLEFASAGASLSAPGCGFVASEAGFDEGGDGASSRSACASGDCVCGAAGGSISET